MLIETENQFLHQSYGASVKSMNILGISMDCLSYEQMHAAFDWWISDKTRPALSVALVNVNCCVSASRTRWCADAMPALDCVELTACPSFGLPVC